MSIYLFFADCREVLEVGVVTWSLATAIVPVVAGFMPGLVLSRILVNYLTKSLSLGIVDPKFAYLLCCALVFIKLFWHVPYCSQLTISLPMHPSK